ncbi:MAG: exosortase A [Pseudomonadota bacterium]|jgi:exosortase A|nr:exosortase A [Rubrivivax sp.]
MSAVLPAAPAGAGPWRIALPVALALFAALLLLYGPTFASMVQVWSRSDTFAHGFLVAPISGWLVWRLRARLARIVPRPSPWVLLPMAAAALLWLLADLAGVHAAAQLAATTLLVLAVPALLGVTFARAITFPLAFLLFMVPIGEFTQPRMMEWTADVTVAFIRAIGIPVYREGLQFVIPSGTWSVVEACSGVRYLIASFMVGTLFAYLNYSSPRKRLVFGLVSLLVPIVANWLRAIMIVLLGHYSGNRLAVGVDHLIYGWVFFGVVIMLMFWIGAKWSDPEDAAVAGPAGPAAPVATAGAPVSAAPAAAWKGWVAATAATLAVAALPPWAARQLDGHDAAALVLQLPAATATAEDKRFPVPSFVRPAAEARTVLATGAGPLFVHVAYYRHQGYENKLANSQNQLVRSDDHAWAYVSQGEGRITAGSRQVPVRTAQLRGGTLMATSSAERVHVRQTFWVGGELTSNRTHALLLGLRNRLLGRGDDAASVIFMLRGGDAAATAAALDAEVARHAGAMLAALDAARGAGAAR